jgi:hypothetical protein
MWHKIDIIVFLLKSSTLFVIKVFITYHMLNEKFLSQSIGQR